MERSARESPKKEMEERHLRDLVTRAIPEVAAGIRRMVGDSDLAEDLLQETLLTALVKLPELRAPFHLTAWLKVIARNKCLRALRGRRRMMSLENLPTWQELIGAPPVDEDEWELRRQLLRGAGSSDPDRSGGAGAGGNVGAAAR